MSDHEHSLNPSSDSERPATSPQKKPVDASTCAPSSSVAQVISVAQPGDEGFVLLDDRLLQTQSSIMQKAQVHEVKPTEAFDLVAWETTLRAGDASTRGLYHVGKWSVYPGWETDPEPEIVLTGVIPEAIPISRVKGSKALATATAGPSRPAKKKKEKVVKFRSKFAIPQIVVEEPSTARPLNPPTSQPLSLEEQPAQSHQGTSQPIHSGELYINVGRIGEEYFARMVKSKDEEKARMEAILVECRKDAQAARAHAEKMEAKWVELCAVYRQLYAKHDGLLKAAKDADDQAQAKIQLLEAENARSAEEITRLGDKLEKERSERASLAAAWAVQAPEEFASQALPDRETAIRFFQGLYKHKVSAGIVDEIGTFGYESGQYTERRALYGILEQRIQGFRPKALSLPDLHDEEPVPPFPGI
ncbi:unnamed protein product [Cuscuta campestris]|uniref:Uncharacterized protein n=1 Tax=Cuscuta campestris TaxID=132261 RepID=A0A484MXH8_9ASTE|nr:unnamed protein product [Cuscuta campestris]